VECLELPEHQSHPEPTIENAISHYKVSQVIMATPRYWLPKLLLPIPGTA
jgi:hypothetical protein